MKNVLKSIIAIGCLVALILTVPSIHHILLRTKVESQVVRITNEKGNSGGTGVHIKLPSGKVAILTNSHICQLRDEHNNLWVAEDGERAIPKRIIEDANFTDLCLVEPLEHHSGLSLASSTYSGEHIYAIGHPLLMPITMTDGELIFQGEAEVMDHFGEQDCNKPKNKLVPVNFFGETVAMACLIHVIADYTTVHILPGSSGSPVVNGYGHIVGLMFAGDGEIHWGLMITLSDIRKLIELH